MNVIREIQRINEKELDIAINNPSASWHQQYKDSAYIFIGGLPYDLTEGDVITIFSQYGEVIDVNLPRGGPPPGGQNGEPPSQQQQQQQEQRKGKYRGFGFLMYEDQRSTVLAVDNLNGATVLGRTLRVDHVSKYKQKGTKGEDGKYIEPEHQSMNAAPQMLDDAESEEEKQPESDLDLEDPMAAYFRKQKREGKTKDGDRAREKEEKARRKEERARIRAKRAARQGGSSSRRRRSRSEEEQGGRNRYHDHKAARRSKSPSRREKPYDDHRRR